MKTSETERVSKIIYNAFLAAVASYRSIDEMVDLIRFYEKINLQGLIALEVFYQMFGNFALIDEAKEEAYDNLREQFECIDHTRETIALMVKEYFEFEDLFETKFCRIVESLPPEKRFYYEIHKLGD